MGRARRGIADHCAFIRQESGKKQKQKLDLRAFNGSELAASWSFHAVTFRIGGQMTEWKLAIVFLYQYVRRAAQR